MFTEEDLSLYKDIEFEEDDLQAFDLEHMTSLTEMSIDQLVEKITVAPNGQQMFSQDPHIRQDTWES